MRITNTRWLDENEKRRSQGDAGYDLPALMLYRFLLESIVLYCII